MADVSLSSIGELPTGRGSESAVTMVAASARFNCVRCTQPPCFKLVSGALRPWPRSRAQGRGCGPPRAPVGVVYRAAVPASPLPCATGPASSHVMRSDVIPGHMF
eukprot:COSAG06_NODE_1486_length_9299_cov_3.915435_6_plen_105_part_00